MSELGSIERLRELGSRELVSREQGASELWSKEQRFREQVLSELGSE